MYSTVQYSSATVLLCYRKVLYSTIHGPAEKYCRIEKIHKYTKNQKIHKSRVNTLVINVVMTSVKWLKSKSWLKLHVRKSYDYDCESQIKSDQLSHSQMPSQSHDFYPGSAWLRSCVLLCHTIIPYPGPGSPHDHHSLLYNVYGMGSRELVRAWEHPQQWNC